MPTTDEQLAKYLADGIVMQSRLVDFATAYPDFMAGVDIRHTPTGFRFRIIWVVPSIAGASALLHFLDDITDPEVITETYNFGLYGDTFLFNCTLITE